ncbi:MAG: ABC transporter substrate-binding protein [Hyphomicrobiales bacterium]|nr:ABC transporter substrate-binding protein [Hyphomicrobiales bacterium]
MTFEPPKFLRCAPARFRRGRCEKPIHRDRLSIGLIVITLLWTAAPCGAQTRGGVLRIYTPDSPASMSIHEEVTIFAQGPMMPVFNNLLLFDYHKPQASLDTIEPDLATDWGWDETRTALTLHLRQGVKWHDGEPFSAADVKCTWNLLLEKSPEKLRINPRKSTWVNLDDVTTSGDWEVSFHLKRPEPAFPMFLASGFSPVYPCHVSPAQMRQHPIGTGSFKFVEFKPNEYIKIERNPNYWNPGLPYLDGVEYRVIRNPATAILAFASGSVDMTFPYQLTVTLLRDVQTQVPQAICDLVPDGINRHLIINRDEPPFNTLDLRRAMALSLDRKAFIDILTEGQGDIGGVLQPPPAGLWGMPPEKLAALPGYDPDVAKNRAEARQLMQAHGYGPGNRLKVKVTTRDLPLYRDPAVLMIDQLKEIFIDGELEAVETPAYFPKIYRKDFTVGLNLQNSGPDPDPIFQLFYGCGAGLNWDRYCNPGVDGLIAQLSAEPDAERRRELAWAIERRLAEEVVRPIIFYSRGATCWQPYVKGYTSMINTLYNVWRFVETAWLDR